MSTRNLPHHLYVWVDSSFIRKGGKKGFEPAVWFALKSEPGESWGCHILTEEGAFFRGLPVHSLAFCEDPEPSWTLPQASCWDCYGTEFDLIRYQYLVGLKARYDGGDDQAICLFTACPTGDAFSAAVQQNKEFSFLQTTGGRLLVRPSNMLLFEERSFTEDKGWPTDIKTSTQIWRAE